VISASVGNAQLRLMGGHGDLVVHHLPDLPYGRIYELWVQHGSGSPSPSTLFAVTSRDTADIGVPGNISGVRAVMVTQEPAGGSRVPTSSPLIVARLG
jgi:anti-sigma-K factor RskA